MISHHKIQLWPFCFRFNLALESQPKWPLLYENWILLLGYGCICVYQRGGKHPSRALPHLHLRSLVCASGTQLSPYFLNWDSYFNSFWEPWIQVPVRRLYKMTETIINFIVYHTWDKHANHYITTTTDAVWFFDLTRTRIHDLPHLRQAC
jgi:hypothetical protein